MLELGLGGPGRDPERAVLEVDARVLSARHVAGEDRVGEQVLDVFLDRALERAGAELGVEARLFGTGELSQVSRSGDLG